MLEKSKSERAAEKMFESHSEMAPFEFFLTLLNHSVPVQSSLYSMVIAKGFGIQIRFLHFKTNNSLLEYHIWRKVVSIH